jgi:hypothetical protein
MRGRTTMSNRRFVFVTGRVACGIHEPRWLPPAIYVDGGHTNPGGAKAGLLYVSLETEPDKIFACITNRYSPDVTILDDADTAHVRQLTAGQVADLPPVHVTLPSGTRLEPGRIAELVDLASRPAAAGHPRLTPRCEANDEGQAAIDRITRRLWHTSQHRKCPIWLAGRVQDDVEALRAEFGLPEFGWNDAVPDEEVGRCSVHPENCIGQHTHNPPVPFRGRPGAKA